MRKVTRSWRGFGDDPPGSFFSRPGNNGAPDHGEMLKNMVTKKDIVELKRDIGSIKDTQDLILQLPQNRNNPCRNVIRVSNILAFLGIA